VREKTGVFVGPNLASGKSIFLLSLLKNFFQLLYVKFTFIIKNFFLLNDKKCSIFLTTLVSLKEGNYLEHSQT